MWAIIVVLLLVMIVWVAVIRIIVNRNIANAAIRKVPDRPIPLPKPSKFDVTIYGDETLIIKNVKWITKSNKVLIINTDTKELNFNLDKIKYYEVSK